MHFALQYRQAVIVRANATRKQRIAVEQQMLRRNRCGGACARLRHILGGFARGDVLHHNFQLGHGLPQRLQHALDEHRFAIEDVDLRIRHLAVHQQGYAVALHGF